jgi:hypothetical protein
METRPPWFGSALAAALVVGASLAPVTNVAAAQAGAPVAAPTDDADKASGEKADHARNAGVVEGEVMSVDYQRGLIALQTPKRGRVDVFVLPSTNIQGRGDSFHTIADISRGSRLRIFLSERAGKFIAQIIHLR